VYHAGVGRRQNAARALALLAVFVLSVSGACARAGSGPGVVPTMTSVQLAELEAQEPDAEPASPTPSETATSPVEITVMPPAVSPVPSATSSPTPMPTPTASATSTIVPLTDTPACTQTAGRVETGLFYSAVIGRDQPYRVYLPPCYDFTDVRYPALYMLHGYPYDDAHWDDLGMDEAADAGIANETLPPFIIAMPAADNEGTYTQTSGGPRSFEAVFMDEFLPFIESTYRVTAEARARAIGGMSRGAVWSLEIAFRHPDDFNAVGGHSAALNVNLAPPVYDPIQLATDPAIRSLRIFLDAGRDDWVLPGMEQLHAALTSAGVEHEYILYEGFHDDSYWSAHVPEYLAFYADEW
jgi:enterochelin esterase-like enzyme